MAYIKDEVYPISEQQIRDNHPHTGFPYPMEAHHVAEFGYEPVHEASPIYDPLTAKVTERPPMFAGGQWFQDWEISPKWDTLAEARADLKARVAERRWQTETGGTTIAGIPVATDVQSQTKITGALSLVTRNPGLRIQWKGNDGVFVWLDKAAMEAVADGVGAFVIACFNAEAAHVAAIDALPSIAACQGYDVGAGWPA